MLTSASAPHLRKWMPTATVMSIVLSNDSLPTWRALANQRPHMAYKGSEGAMIGDRSEAMKRLFGDPRQNDFHYNSFTVVSYDLPHFDQPPQYHIDQSPPQDLEFERLSKIEIDHLRENVLSTQIPNPLFDLDTEESGDDTEVIFDKELFLRRTVDDLVPILRESEVTSVSNDLECSMPFDSPPLPCIDVLGEEKVDIDLPFGEHLHTISTGKRILT
ncbi:hypothetical protein Tco_0574383 [Tanacetum coccineum]